MLESAARTVFVRRTSANAVRTVSDVRGVPVSGRLNSWLTGTDVCFSNISNVLRLCFLLCTYLGIFALPGAVLLVRIFLSVSGRFLGCTEIDTCAYQFCLAMSIRSVRPPLGLTMDALIPP